MPRIRPGWPIGPHALPVEMAHVNQWFHAISESTRMTILQFLSQRERCVTELQHILDAPQSSVSYHLNVLRESGLVRARREGRWKYFSLRAETLEHMSTFSRVIGPGKHAGTCPLTCCRDPLDVSTNVDTL
jgi:ArsR family transcriptional regulator